MPDTVAPTMEAQRVAALAAIANDLAKLAETAIRAGCTDLALILLRESRSVLVNDLVFDPAVTSRVAAEGVARRHVQRVLQQRLTAERLADLERARAAEAARKPVVRNRFIRTR